MKSTCFWKAIKSGFLSKMKNFWRNFSGQCFKKKNNTDHQIWWTISHFRLSIVIKNDHFLYFLKRLTLKKYVTANSFGLKGPRKEIFAKTLYPGISDLTGRRETSNFSKFNFYLRCCLNENWKSEYTTKDQCDVPRRLFCRNFFLE